MQDTLQLLPADCQAIYLHRSLDPAEFKGQTLTAQDDWENERNPRSRSLAENVLDLSIRFRFSRGFFRPPILTMSAGVTTTNALVKVMFATGS